MSIVPRRAGWAGGAGRGWKAVALCVSRRDSYELDIGLLIVSEKPRFQVLFWKVSQSLPIDSVECSGGEMLVKGNRQRLSFTMRCRAPEFGVTSSNLDDSELKAP